MFVVWVFASQRENSCAHTSVMVWLLCDVVAQSRVHTAVVMASRQPATLVTSRPHTQCHSSIRLLLANQRLGQESIRRAPLHHRRLSRHFLRCRLATSTNSRDQSRWLPNSMLAIFDLTPCHGITLLRQVNNTDNDSSVFRGTVVHNRSWSECIRISSRPWLNCKLQTQVMIDHQSSVGPIVFCRKFQILQINFWNSTAHHRIMQILQLTAASHLWVNKWALSLSLSVVQLLKCSKLL